jgi:Uma2 family endonuclease
MATPSLIPVEEYLATTYRPDCDFIEGALRERNVGETQHSAIQGLLAAIFYENRKRWSARSFIAQRVQINSSRFRIPDVCVLPLGAPPDPIIHTAPFICIEVYSRDDTPRELQGRIDDYIALGVQNIWLFDPARRRAWSVNANGAHIPVDHEFSVPGTPIRIPLEDLYAELDDQAAGR